MNRNLVTSLITIIAAGLVAFGVTRWTARAASEPSMDRLQNSDWLERALKLAPDQVAELRKLEQAYGSDLSDCCERHCAARMEIGETLFKPDWNSDKQKELSEKLCKAQLDTEVATLEHIRKVHSLLTPDQQTTYEELVSSCICSACPNNLHQP